jgi:hypothetical protein
LWTLCCLLADLRASKLINETISILIALIAGGINVVLLSLPSNYGFNLPQKLLELMDKSGYSPVQYVQYTINTLLLPFVVLCSVTLIIINAYAYWEEKYSEDEITSK